MSESLDKFIVSLHTQLDGEVEVNRNVISHFIDQNIINLQNMEEALAVRNLDYGEPQFLRRELIEYKEYIVERVLSEREIIEKTVEEDTQESSKEETEGKVSGEELEEKKTESTTPNKRGRKPRQGKQ